MSVGRDGEAVATRVSPEAGRILARAVRAALRDPRPGPLPRELLDAVADLPGEIRAWLFVSDERPMAGEPGYQCCGGFWTEDAYRAHTAYAHRLECARARP